MPDYALQIILFVLLTGLVPPALIAQDETLGVELKLQGITN
jgi:hypothetical protein